MKWHVFIAGAAVVVFLAPLRGEDPGDKITMAYIQKLQTPAGAFLPQAAAGQTPAPATLRSTSSAPHFWTPYANFTDP